MTIYACSICNGAHDTSNPNDHGCPQMIPVLIPVTQAPQPVSPDDTQPMWKRRYYCPQCPQYVQRDGFDLPGFISHTASHSSAYLLVALEELRRLDGALHELEGNVQALPGLALMYADLAVLRAFHHKERDAWNAWEAMAKEAKSCPTCTASRRGDPASDQPRAAHLETSEGA